MTWITQFFSFLLSCLLFQQSFSYPYPGQALMPTMRRHMVPSRSSQTWVPYPVMMPNFAPKISMRDYPPGGSNPFLRPPMPPASPLLPSSNYILPTVASPPRQPLIPPTATTPPAKASDRSSSLPPPPNKEYYRRQPRPKTKPEYIRKDWDEQDEDKWEKRFNRIDASPNFHKQRRPQHGRRYFQERNNRRNFEDSEERMRDERRFPLERDERRFPIERDERRFPVVREENSRESRDDDYFRRPKPMMRPRHDFRRPKPYRESDEEDADDMYSSREQRDEFFNKRKMASRSDSFRSDSAEQKTSSPNRRSDQDPQSHRKPKSRNDQHQQFSSSKNTHFRIRGTDKVRNSVNDYPMMKDSYRDSVEAHNTYKSDADDYNKNMVTKKPKNQEPIKKAFEDYDSPELPWSYEESAERKRINKPNAGNEDKTKRNTFIYRNVTKKEMPDVKMKEESEEFGRPYQRNDEKSFQDVQVHDTAPSTLKTKSSERRRDFVPEEVGGKNQRDFSKKDRNSAEGNKKDSWNWSSAEIVVRDEEVSDSPNDSENYESHNYDNTDAEDKEEAAMVGGGSELLKISSNSESATVEKSYLDDSYATEAMPASNSSTSSRK